MTYVEFKSDFKIEKGYQPSDKAKRICEKLMNNWSKINDEGNRYTHWMAGSDPWGPSGSDLNDGYDRKIKLICNIIDKELDKK